MLNNIEEQILKKIYESHLVNKNEIISFLNNNGHDVGEEVVITAVKNLEEKSLIKTVNPLSSTCYVITKKGIDFIRGL
ncbi:MAG: hypothetical protein ACTSVB_06930 [Candidatus Heimdallarchaeaceae archaeon]